MRGAPRVGARRDGSIDNRVVDAFNRNGGPASVGTPQGFVYDFADGQMQEFDGGGGGRGAIMTKGGTAFWVHGAIYTKYDADPFAPGIQGPLFAEIGYPTADETEEPAPRFNHTGRATRFERGLIAHHISGPRDRQTFEVHGSVYQKYATLGLGSWIGYPMGQGGGGESGPGQLDEFTNSAGFRQGDFEGGYITQRGAGQPFDAFTWADPIPPPQVPFSARYIFQTPYPTAPPGGWALVEFGLQNTGTETWTRAGTNRLHLGTTMPRDRGSAFFTDVPNPSGWVSNNRIRMRDDRDVPPGQNAYFRAWFRVPETFDPSTQPYYQEHFQAVADGSVGWFGPDLWVRIYVSGPRRLFAQLLRQSPREISLYPGQRATVWADFENRGALLWQNVGQPFTVLGTINGDGVPEYPSPFYIPGVWDSPTRPGRGSLSNPVSPPDGFGLHSGRFQFQIQAPNRPGNTDEHFQLFLDSDRIPFGGASRVAWNVTVMADNRPPRIESVTFDPPSPSNAPNVRVRVEASDAETGVERIEVAVNSAPDGSDSGIWHDIGVVQGSSGELLWNTAIENYPDGVHRIDFQVVDRAGNWLRRGTSYALYALDRTGPTVVLNQTPSAPGLGHDGWVIAPLTVDLEAVDREWGRRARILRYGWDDPTSPGERYESPFSVPEGEHTLHVLAADELGNSTRLTRTFRVDTGLPETTLAAAAVGPPGSGAATLTFLGADAVTPLANLRYSYAVNDGPWSEPSGAVTVRIDGLEVGRTHLFRARAIDLAGNEDPTPALAAVFIPPPPPEQPGGLTVTVESATTLRLTWEDRSDNESGFELERAAPGAEFVLIHVAAPDTRTYLDEGLDPNTTYTYRLRAVNEGGSSADTAAVSGLTLPVPPTGLTVTAPRAPEGLSSLVLTWTEAGPRPSALKLERASAADSPFVLLSGLPAGTASYTDRGLEGGRTYLYRLRGSNASGDSEPTPVVSGTTLFLPYAPDRLQAQAVNSRSIRLAWRSRSAAVSGIEVERQDTTGDWRPLKLLDGAATTYVDRNLEPGTRYTYRVRACGSGGCSEYSEEAEATTPEAPLRLASLTFASDTLRQGEPVRGRVRLTGAAGMDTPVNLTVNRPGLVRVPGRVVVRAGRREATFTAVALRGGRETRVTVTATLGGSRRTRTLTVR